MIIKITYLFVISQLISGHVTLNQSEMCALNCILHAINIQIMHSFSVASFEIRNQCRAVRTNHQTTWHL